MQIFYTSYSNRLIMNHLELKRIREESGLTQKDFAERISVSIRTVQNWEGDLRSISESHAFHVNSIFTFPIGYLSSC